VQIGDSVLMTEGPFVGRIARLALITGQRVIVGMQVGVHQVDVEIDVDWVTAMTPQRKSATRINESAIQLLRSDRAH